jgi:ribosomal protein S18 acetylase RimI-like enzyme
MSMIMSSPVLAARRFYNPVSRWWKAHEAEKYLPENFLRASERFCVSACARFRDLNYFQDHAWVFSVGSLNDTRAMILHSQRTIFPVFNGLTQLAIPVHLLRTLKSIDIHALHGLSRDIEILEQILLPLGFTSKGGVDFFLMSLDSPRDLGALKAPPAGLILRRGRQSDEEELFPWQSVYEKEEVLSEGALFDPRVSRFNLARILKNERILVAELDGRLVGKINTNAKSYSRYQIGGVYVRPEYRNLGIGAYMTAAFTRLLLKERAGASLFVRKENLPAISIYTKAGFKNIGNYKISYM